MADVHITGIQKPMGGTKESVAAFRKHHKETADALLNITEGKDVDDPRPGYIYQPFPKMIFHPEHGEKIVQDDAELQEFLLRGWRKEPYIKPRVAVQDREAEKVQLEQKLKEKDGQITTLSDMLARVEARLARMEEKEAIKAGAKPDPRAGVDDDEDVFIPEPPAAEEPKKPAKKA